MGDTASPSGTRESLQLLGTVKNILEHAASGRRIVMLDESANGADIGLGLA